MRPGDDEKARSTPARQCWHRSTARMMFGKHKRSPVVRKKQSRPVEPAAEFADRVAPTKSVRTQVWSSRSVRSAQNVESGLECRRLEDAGSAASEGFARSDGGCQPIIVMERA